MHGGTMEAASGGRQVAELLEAAGARVSTAASAEDALRMMDNEAPQVLGDGPRNATRRRLSADRAGERTSQSRRATPVGGRVDGVRALRWPREGVTRRIQIHLARPIDPAELVTAIAALAQRFDPDGLERGSHSNG
jgi:CheY-like chemotaxis protein